MDKRQPHSAISAASSVLTTKQKREKKKKKKREETTEIWIASAESSSSSSSQRDRNSSRTRRRFLGIAEVANNNCTFAQPAGNSVGARAVSRAQCAPQPLDRAIAFSRRWGSEDDARILVSPKLPALSRWRQRPTSNHVARLETHDCDI
jgi:hypothetical protein